MRGKYVRGTEAIGRVFKRLPYEADRRIAVALNRSAEEVVQRARALAPRDTGALAAQIGHRIEEKPRSVAAVVYSGAFYSAWVEFGTAPGVRGERRVISKRRRLVKRTHPGSEAKPFFFPAYRSVRRRIRARVARALSAAARAAVRGR